MWDSKLTRGRKRDQVSKNKISKPYLLEKVEEVQPHQNHGYKNRNRSPLDKISMLLFYVALYPNDQKMFPLKIIDQQFKSSY
jgi:hypothetical protein